MDAALQLNPKNVPILLWRAATLTALGRQDEAREQMSAVLALNSNMNARYLRRTNAYETKETLDNLVEALVNVGLPQ